MSDKLALLDKDLRPREEQSSDLWRHVINSICELNRQRALLADIPEDAWKQLAQNCIDSEGKRETHWLSMLDLHDSAKGLTEQIQRQFAPLFRAGLLERDLSDEELAEALLERPDNQFELSDAQFEQPVDQCDLSDDQFELTDDKLELSEGQVELSEGQLELSEGQLELSDEELFEQLNFYLSDEPQQA